MRVVPGCMESTTGSNGLPRGPPSHSQLCPSFCITRGRGGEEGEVQRDKRRGIVLGGSVYVLPNMMNLGRGSDWMM